MKTVSFYNMKQLRLSITLHVSCSFYKAENTPFKQSITLFVVCQNVFWVCMTCKIWVCLYLPCIFAPLQTFPQTCGSFSSGHGSSLWAGQMSALLYHHHRSREMNSACDYKDKWSCYYSKFLLATYDYGAIRSHRSLLTWQMSVRLAEMEALPCRPGIAGTVHRHRSEGTP